MAGSAVIVALQQLKGLLGIKHFSKKMAVVLVLSSVFQNKHEVAPFFLFFSIFFLNIVLLIKSLTNTNKCQQEH